MPDFGRWNANGGDPSLNEINRSDQFLDALASQQQPFATDHAEAELAQLLAGWRDDVRETPMGHVVSEQQAAAALDKVTRPAPRRRLSLAVVGSAAAAVLAIGGVGAVIAGSGPGDALYGLRTMLFGEQAQTRDDAVILAAQTEMQQVQQLIEQGDWQGAQAKLEAVTTTVATVNDVAQKEELIAQWQELTVKVEAQDPVATVPPGSPLPTFPDVPAVVLDPGTSSETTAPSETSTSGTSATATSETSTSETAPSETTSSETAPSETTTSAPSATTTPPSPTTTVGATSSAPSSTSSSTPAAPTPSPTTTTTTATRAASPTPTTASSAPAPTSTSVVLQSTTTTRAALPTTTAVPTTTAAAPTPSPTPRPTTTVAPTAEEEVQEPAVRMPTTTTLIVPIPAPDDAG